MINPGAGIIMKRVFDSLDYFSGIAKKIPTGKLMGIVDGMYDGKISNKGRFAPDSTMLWPMDTELKNRIENKGFSNVDLNDYFGAYLNGYLVNAGIVKRVFDITGKTTSKYKNATDWLDVEFRKKSDIYVALEEKKLLVYDDRDFENFEPRFRLEVED